jgi:hypothetical protein
MKFYWTPFFVGLKDLLVVTVEGIGVDLVVMIILIIGLQGAHHIEVAGIIHQGTLPTVEGIGGKGLGHLMLHMVAQIGGMLVGLGDILH